MFKKIRNEPLAVLVLVVLLGLGLVAAKPAGMTGLTSLWVGDQTATADITPGANDVFVAGTMEIDGALAVAGAFTNSNTQSFAIPIGGVYVEAAGMIGTATSPSIMAASVNGLPIITIGASTETTSFSYSFNAPDDYSGALAFRMFYQTDRSATSPDSFKMHWRLWVNKSNTNVDAAPFNQTEVTASSTEYKTSNQVMTFTANTTALAGISAGDLVTVIWQPVDGRNQAYEMYNFQIPGIEVQYTAAR